MNERIHNNLLPLLVALDQLCHYFRYILEEKHVLIDLSLGLLVGLVRGLILNHINTYIFSFIYARFLYYAESTHFRDLVGIFSQIGWVYWDSFMILRI